MPHRGRNRCSGKRGTPWKRRNMYSTGRFRSRPYATPPRPTNASSILPVWLRITDSSKSGRRTVPRISRTAPRWSAPRSRGSKVGTSTPNASTKRPSARPAQTASSTTKRSPTKWPRASTPGEASKSLPVCICRKPATAISVGGPMARCGNSNSFIRISATHQSLHLLPLPLARPSSGWMSGRCSRPRRRCPARSSSVSLSRRCCGSQSNMPAPSVACSSCSRTTSCGSRRKRRSAAARLRSRCARRPCHRPSFPNPCSADEYLCQKRARSVLCLPLVKQAKLIGVLYLENNLASHVFTPARISVLELLASQAAISLENARLYNDLQEREARIRRLVDSDIIGIIMWDLEGRILDANEAFLHMVGYSRDDLFSGDLRWTAMTPAEWNYANERAAAEMSATGSHKPFEKEYFRKDGSRVPVLLGGAAFDERRDQGVSFVLDLTERKRAEESLRESEQRYREAQMALAHANRVTTMGELAASIAHETNQPLAAVVANAEACLRWLDRETPDLAAARRSVEWVIDDGNRASEVIRRVRSLANKTEIEKVPLDVNDVVREVI